ncbi:MAG: hypothetical protein JSU57_05305 [Candidatus Heimdallarchaeota archaeon]|nr:MAG: hypothetical protein JSU57_05305 [Candidatus Heimdallarchaeota archaeon]
MATREEKQIRLDLPSTSGVECEIRDSPSRDEFIFTFFQNERQFKSSSVPKSQVSPDTMVDLLSDAGIEFFSFSAIFDVAELLIKTINDEFQQLIVVEEEPSAVIQPSVTEDLEEVTPIAAMETESADVQVSAEPELKISIDPGDKLLKKFEMPYSKAGYAAVYYCRDGNYRIVLFQNETPAIRKKFPKDGVNEDNLVAMISESGIDFLSFSAIYDTAEELQNIILHPEEYLEAEKITTTEPAIGVGEPITTISEVEEPEDEMVMVDLSTLDVSKYTKVKDFDQFIAEVTTSVNEGQPLPVKEVEIEHTGGVVCIILRQMDSWFIRFKTKEGSYSDVTEVKVDQDELARLINQEIPQISFSYLYDASEKVFKTIQQLAKRPMGDVILNVAVSHFLQITEQHEAENNFKAAAKITEVLLERFRREKNTKGILQFGKKLLDYFEEQKKNTKAIKLRNELVEELLEIDVNSAQNFVLEALEKFVSAESFLNAANLCGLLLDHYLSDEDNIEALKYVMQLGRTQIDFYKKARLPSVMEDNALRYARYSLRQLRKIDDNQITVEQKTSYQEDIRYLLDQAFESQEERRLHFEMLESLENILNLLKEVDDKQTYLKYVDQLIISLETQDKTEKALNVTIESTHFLLDSENFVKACEYGNKAIKLFYQLNKITEAIDFSLDIIRALVNLKETNAARDYIRFVESLVEKAYETDEKRRVEKQLIIGDLFGKLGLKDQAKAYIQAALQTIGDARKREKIVINYVDDLLENHATLSAQEMINQELSRLLTTGDKIAEIIRFCQNFIEKLREYNQLDMGFEYMKYSSNLMIQTDYTDYKVLQGFIKDLQELNKLDNAAFIMNQLVILQKKHQDYTRAIDIMTKFIDYLLENTERFDLVEYYIQRTAEVYHEMGDPEGSTQALISFQKQILVNSIELAQRITDSILKEIEQKEDYKNCINIVSPLIDKQLELGRFQDAYIFSVQNARYYERLGDITKVMKYLEDIRDKFLSYEQFEEANRMTDLILRFGQSHKKYKLAISAMKGYSKNALDRGDTATSAKFGLEVANLLEEENQGEKALEFLQMIFNTIYEAEDQESAIQIFQRIMEIRGEKAEFKKVARKYLEPLFHKYPDILLIDTAKQVLKPPFEDLFSFSEKIYDNMLSSNEISQENAEAVVNFVISTYDEGWGDEGDRIANKYSYKLLNADQIPHASRLMAIILEKTAKPMTEVLLASFDFIQELINNSLLEDAREFTDRVIKTAENRFGGEGRVLAAKISQKFAIFVASENPDLASEYAYQASSFYRSLNDFKGVVTVYTKLAERISSPKQAIRAYKRGINICKKFKADKYEAQLLSRLTEYLISSNNRAAIASVQQTLEKYEQLQNLEDLFNVVYNLIEVSIKSDNLKIAFTYLDYMTRLSSMINKKEDVGGILVFLLRHAKEVKDSDRLELVQKYIDELGIKPKKYKKDYAMLAEQRMAHVEETLGKIEAVELEEELEPVPELVEAGAIIPLAPEVTPVEPSQETIDEKIDDEFVSVIKEFGEAVSEEPQVELDKEQIFPVLDEVFIDRTIEPSPVEVPSVEKPEVVQPELEEIIEAPPHEEPEIPETAALSDSEISSLFSAAPSPTQVAPPKEAEIPPEIIPEKKVSEVREAALSEEEVESLFIPRVESPSIEVERPEIAIREEEISEDEEWEVDSFGRLWKKGTLPPVTEELDEPKIETEELPTDVVVATPDLSPLEKIIQEAGTKEVTEDIKDGIFEEALKEPSIISTETPTGSIEDILTQEEESVAKDIFTVPQVEYQEITPIEEAKESQVKTPDLADLFSDALSELGSISGETGESDKDKKRKK